MKSIKTAGLLSAILAVVVLAACLPARSAESTILYVRNQVYTAPTLRSDGNIYASLSGLLKALRFGWKVSGTSVIISNTGASGPALGVGPYAYVYRNRPVVLPTRIENGETWVSARSLAQSIGAGYQVNNDLHIAEIYFVAAAAPPAPATLAAPASVAPVASTTPAAVASAEPPAPGTKPIPPATGTKPVTPASGAPASPAASGVPTEAPPTPSPTPQPEVNVSRSAVVPDWTNGKLNVTVEVENPADVPAKDVTVKVVVASGEGTQIGTQTLYFGVLTPHQKSQQAFVVDHPDGTSMPRSLYEADCTVTFNR